MVGRRTTRGGGRCRGLREQRGRTGLEGEPEQATWCAVVTDEARTNREGCGPKDPGGARECRGGVVLDVGEPVADGRPAEREQDRANGEDRQRVGVQPRCKQRPASLRQARRVVLK